MILLRSILASLLATVALVSPALAAEAKTTLPDVEDEVMCVSCNVPLSIAESPQASRQREYIRTLVGQGLTKQQIKDKLVAEYGKDVLAMPDEGGIGLAAYLVPIAVVLALIAAAAVLLPRWRRRVPAVSPAVAGPRVSEAELQRLDEDLRRFE